MSLHSYRASFELSAQDPPFSALIMAAMRKGDTLNSRKLQAAFPEIWDELQDRYNAPGGLLGQEQELPPDLSGDLLAVPANRIGDDRHASAEAGLAMAASVLKPSAYERLTGKPWVGTAEKRAALEATGSSE